MTYQNMRQAISTVYPGDRWRNRLMSMPDNQVVAIYNHFLRDGIFNKVRKQTPSFDYRQQTLWDDYGIKK